MIYDILINMTNELIVNEYLASIFPYFDNDELNYI